MASQEEEEPEGPSIVASCRAITSNQSKVVSFIRGNHAQSKSSMPTHLSTDGFDGPFLRKLSHHLHNHGAGLLEKYAEDIQTSINDGSMIYIYLSEIASPIYPMFFVIHMNFTDIDVVDALIQVINTNHRSHFQDDNDPLRCLVLLPSNRRDELVVHMPEVYVNQPMAYSLARNLTILLRQMFKSLDEIHVESHIGDVISRPLYGSSGSVTCPQCLQRLQGTKKKLTPQHAKACPLCLGCGKIDDNEEPFRLSLIYTIEAKGFADYNRDSDECSRLESDEYFLSLLRELSIQRPDLTEPKHGFRPIYKYSIGLFEKAAKLSYSHDQTGLRLLIDNFGTTQTKQTKKNGFIHEIRPGNASNYSLIEKEVRSFNSKTAHLIITSIKCTQDAGAYVVNVDGTNARNCPLLCTGTGDPDALHPAGRIYFIINSSTISMRCHGNVENDGQDASECHAFSSPKSLSGSFQTAVFPEIAFARSSRNTPAVSLIPMMNRGRGTKDPKDTYKDEDKSFFAELQTAIDLARLSTQKIASLNPITQKIEPGSYYYPEFTPMPLPKRLRS